VPASCFVTQLNLINVYNKPMAPITGTRKINLSINSISFSKFEGAKIG